MNALIYAAGVFTGVALMIANRCSVKKAVDHERSRSDALRRENEKLREEISAMMWANDTRNARRRGFEEGRKSPLTQAEQLIDSFGGRNVEIRGRRTA